VRPEHRRAAVQVHANANPNGKMVVAITGMLVFGIDNAMCHRILKARAGD